MEILSREMIDNELVPLLMTINEQISVEDISSLDIYYTDGHVKDALCKLNMDGSMIYLFTDGTVYYTAANLDELILERLASWIRARVSSPELLI
jgi:hypothetical protein